MSEEIKKALSEDVLEEISGGRGKRAGSSAATTTCMCSNCGKNTPHMVYSGGRAVCNICGTPTTA